MTEPDRKFEEEIRRALYAAGDLIVPAGDGLNKIRDRAARRPFAFGWLLAYAAHLPRRLVHGGRVAASEVAATMHGYSSLGLVFASARRWPGQARHVLRTPSVWLRPVLASATALILVIGVTFAIPRLRQQVTAQLASAFGSPQHQSPGGSPGAGGGPAGAQSSGATQLHPGAATHMPGKPWLATMPASSTQCRGQGSRKNSGTGTGRHAGGTGTIPPSEGPGPGQTVGAGTNGGVANSISAIHLNVAPPGDIGPPPVGVMCPPSVKPTTRSTTPVATPPPTTPVVTPPPTTPVVTPPTSTPPTSTPPTSTPPTSTPPTSTPPTSTSPATSTSSANSPASTGPPTESATPGG
jgi:hypothetical protein